MPEPTPLQRDFFRVKYMCTEFVGVAPGVNGQNLHLYDEVYRALAHGGYTHFNRDIVGILDDPGLDLLEYPARNPDTGLVEWKGLPHYKKQRLRITIAFFHYKSRQEDRTIDILDYDNVDFVEFQTKTYRPHKDVQPWGIEDSDLADKKLSAWTKNNKPNSSEYPILKSEMYWTIFKEDFLLVMANDELTKFMRTI